MSPARLCWCLMETYTFPGAVLVWRVTCRCLPLVDCQRRGGAEFSTGGGGASLLSPLQSSPPLGRLPCHVHVAVRLEVGVVFFGCLFKMGEDKGHGS